MKGFLITILVLLTLMAIVYLGNRKDKPELKPVYEKSKAGERLIPDGE